MNIVVSDPKTGKAYSSKTEKPVFVNKKVFDEVDLSVVGLQGYKGIITGGSDKDGFPMKPSLQGTVRKKIFLAPGVGFHSKVKGIRVRKTVRGSMIGEDIHQINVKVTQQGEKTLEEVLGKPKEAKAEGKEEAKKEEAKAEPPKENAKAEAK